MFGVYSACAYRKQRRNIFPRARRHAIASAARAEKLQRARPAPHPELMVIASMRRINSPATTCPTNCSRKLSRCCDPAAPRTCG
eukprot:5513606-Pyramimonas_sp.AAC.1